MLSTRQISTIAVMTAACVATNYLLVGVVNVKFMDPIIFVSGLTFGAVVGSSIGALTWLVYGTINPYGFSLPILVTTCLSEMIYGLAGGVLGYLGFSGNDNPKKAQKLMNGFEFAVIGFLLTAIYDFITNIAMALSLGLPILSVLIAGIIFTLLHEVSNAVFFFLGVAPLVIIIKKIPYLTKKQVMKT